MEAQKRWRPLRGRHRIPQVISMQKFIDGIHESEFKKCNNDNNSMEIYVA